MYFRRRFNFIRLRSVRVHYITTDYVEMTSVLYGGGVGNQGGNPVKAEFNKLQRQVDNLKNENRQLLEAISRVAPDIVDQFQKVKAEDAARDEEAAARAAAEARLAASQNMGQFNVRQGGSGAAQGSYGNIYNNNRFR